MAQIKATPKTIELQTPRRYRGSKFVYTHQTGSFANAGEALEWSIQSSGKRHTRTIKSSRTGLFYVLTN